MRVRLPYWHEIFAFLAYLLMAILVVPAFINTDWEVRIYISIAVALMILIHWLVVRYHP